MRIRTWLTLALGAGLGAGGVYLLDPDHGDARRRALSVRARDRAVGELRDLARAASAQARAVVREARAGFGERDRPGPMAPGGRALRP